MGSLPEQTFHLPRQSEERNARPISRLLFCFVLFCRGQLSRNSSIWNHRVRLVGTSDVRGLG